MLNIGENFLLETHFAQELYQEHAQRMAVIDYHSHISPCDVAEDRTFDTITSIWMENNPYLWRAMRANGVEETYCTGTETDDWLRFEKWAQTMPYLMRSPLYLWSHLALKTVFGIDEALNAQSARRIFDACNAQLQGGGLSAQSLLRRFRIACICTIDDPIDSLDHHRKFRAEGSDMLMLPTWRPDKAMNIEKKEFRSYVTQLGEVANIDISTFNGLVDALQSRHDFFAQNGCRIADHQLEEFYDEQYTDSQIEIIFEKAMRGQDLSHSEVRQYKHCFLKLTAEMNHAANWTQQYHYGILLDNNSLLYESVGQGIGADSIGEPYTAHAMSHFLDDLHTRGKLARTILTCLNPADNDMLCSMTGNFQEAGIPGKLQFGMGWWSNAQPGCVGEQIDALSRFGLLGRSIGVSTGSRSLLSLLRHQYFRRLLCNLLGNDVAKGLLPTDMEAVGALVQDVCYNNAHRYFGF